MTHHRSNSKPRTRSNTVPAQRRTVVDAKKELFSSIRSIEGKQIAADVLKTSISRPNKARQERLGSQITKAQDNKPILQAKKNSKRGVQSPSTERSNIGHKTAERKSKSSEILRDIARLLRLAGYQVHQLTYIGK